MKAFHVNWTRPYTVRNPAAPYAVEPFELLTTMLSALSWRATGGDILMATDALGVSYYEALGLSSLWNGGVHPLLEEAVPDSVSPRAFWAAGKLYALREISAPCVMIDTDFIVWKNITPQCCGADVSVIHREDLAPDIYPDAAHFRVLPGFDMQSLDWSVRPCNTALACFQNDAFRCYYTERAISFMEHAPHADHALTYMVFAEQRMLSMCARAYGAHISSLSDLPELFGSAQTYFTHVWGFKQQMRDDPQIYESFCHRCAARIQKDYPDYASIASHIPSLRRYFT